MANGEGMGEHSAKEIKKSLYCFWDGGKDNVKTRCYFEQEKGSKWGGGLGGRERGEVTQKTRLLERPYGEERGQFVS